jgi:helix-turn-helix protein
VTGPLDRYPPAPPGGSSARGFKYLWERHTTGLGLTAAEQAVAWRLSMYADGDGRNAHPGTAWLVADTGCSKPTVIAALARLRKAGLAEVEEHGGLHPGEGRPGPRADSYRLTLPHEPGSADCDLCRRDTVDGWLSESPAALGRSRRQAPNWSTQQTGSAANRSTEQTGSGPARPANRSSEQTGSAANRSTEQTGSASKPVYSAGSNRFTQATPPDHRPDQVKPAGRRTYTGGTASANGDAPGPSANGDGRRGAAVADEITTAHRAACRPQLLPAAVRQHSLMIQELIAARHDPADVAAALTDWRDRHNRGERVEHGLIPILLERREMNRAADDAAVSDPADVAVVCRTCGGAHRDTDPCPT